MERNESEQPGCLGILTQLFHRIFPSGVQESGPLPYGVRDDFLSPTELSYFQVLKSVLGSKAAICAKVRLADLIFVKSKANYMSHFNRISPRHIDFIICYPKTMKPILAIELDDSSHIRPRQQESDLFLDDALAAAGLPLLRVTAQRQYSQQQLIDQLKPYLLKHKPVHPENDGAELVTPNETTAEKQAASVPNCPKCGIPMVLRVATRGKQKGEHFYGCTNYPQCRELISIPPGNSQG